IVPSSAAFLRQVLQSEKWHGQPLSTARSWGFPHDVTPVVLFRNSFSRRFYQLVRANRASQSPNPKEDKSESSAGCTSCARHRAPRRKPSSVDARAKAGNCPQSAIPERHFDYRGGKLHLR